jgi:hypothetical protein
MEMEKTYMDQAKEFMWKAATKNNNCLFNVGRQIGTTTFLIKYAAKWFAENKKSVLMHFDNKKNAAYCWDKILVELRKNKTDIHPSKRNFTIKTDDPDKTFLVAYGKSNAGTILRGHQYATSVGLYTVDNADFFDWEPAYTMITSMNKSVKCIVTSCPTKFTGEWTYFKKIIVSDDKRWKIMTYSTPIVSADTNGFSEAFVNLEFHNYSLFFDEMKILYKNLGKMMFCSNETATKYSELIESGFLDRPVNTNIN